ncbi:Ca2+ regulator and membrane fusion protein Fig1-domain-containing protein [Podospora aff. communis PSN243]|uniref:Ca2+ regulator and membrane fusion protein Fig1-domain-containing protein n=1 Tax=Podospora aff. communis PSN243 TaxID=3040156 RepID=A0AAV9GEC8_9PEZI|nr:Ca2+ regulator and membrane fusion protein Fig1-domain-containing protein [Podospora aff. communis PSN243]
MARSNNSAISFGFIRRKLYRLIPFIGYHHVLMIIALSAITLWSILLAGCTSYSLKDISLFSLSYRQDADIAPSGNPLQLNPNVGDTFAGLMRKSSSTIIQQVNVGFMAICLKLHAGTWICGTSAQDMVNGLAGGAATDPLNLIYVAETARSRVLFFGLLFVAIIFNFFGIILLATFPGWHKEEDSDGSEREVKPFPSRPVSMWALGFFSFALLLSFVTVLWQHLASAAAYTLAKTLTYDTIDASVGAGAMVLGWIGVGCSGVVTLGLLIMVLSIRILATID